MRVIKSAPPLSETDVEYLRYLLTTRANLRDKILGVVATNGDPSSLYRVLRRIEEKLRTRGIRVDSFSNASENT